MWIVYLDESKDDNKFFLYSALIADSDRWSMALKATADFRRKLKSDYSIYTNKELHAWKFAAGKGQIAPRSINKKKRAEIYAEVLRFIATSGFFRIMSAVHIKEEYAFDRLINRLNRTADEQQQDCILICDEGQEVAFTKRVRKMRVYNPIPSNKGVWNDGTTTKNLPISRIIEDPFFKKSHMSYFIQLVDFCAYALLRMERPIPSRSSLGYAEMYGALAPIVFPENNPKDPKGFGIIR